MSRPTDWHDVLGLEDPTPGDPWEIAAVARRWRDVAREAEQAETTLRGLLGDDAVRTWIGQAGDKFRTKSSDLPDQLRQVKESYRLASDAMSWWAGRLEQHQDDADHQLVLGREAQRQLESARVQLGLAEGQVGSAMALPGLTGTAPTPEQVQHAQDRLRSAQSARSAAQGLVDNASARLSAARALALDAGEARTADGREAARRVDAAAEAGLAPRSRWQKVKDGLAGAWDVLVDICKIVVAVLGIVVLIIGGPLAWVVLAAAIILLVDALIAYANGEGSLWGVLFAALGCIPGTKGLTTLGQLSAAFKAGGALGALAHVGGAARSAVVALAQTVVVLRRGFGPGVKAAVAVMGRDGALAVPELRTTLAGVGRAFTRLDNVGDDMASMARRWQGADAFPGVDDYVNTTLDDMVLEAGFPGLSNYAAPAGNAAEHGLSAPDVWEGLQVGPRASADFPDYRAAVVEIHVSTPTPAATGPTLANPQYGPGGTQQYFLDLNAGLADGSLSVFDGTGAPIDLSGMTRGEIASTLNDLHAAGDLPVIELSGANAPRPGISYQHEVVAAPEAFRVPDLGQQRVDAGLADTVDTVRLALQGAGYYGVSR